MDNVTHTLVGLALAESGLKRSTALGTATLVIGANLPDLDALIYAVGTGTEALAFRRGWTHGIFAMVVLPLLLAAGILGWDRLVRRRRPGVPHAGVHAGWLLAIAAVGVWSHPLLDWMNVYGVRLLMPFSHHWYYGDALFIIDPWVWAALGVGVLLTRRRDRLAAADAGRGWATRPARVALAAVVAYAIAMAVSARIGARVVERQASSGPVIRTLVAPVFATPFRRDVIRDLGDRYELGRLTLGWRSRYSRMEIRPIGADQPGVGAARGTKAGAEFLRWARYPEFRIERRGDSIRVTLSDARYADTPGGSWASATVSVPIGGRGVAAPVALERPHGDGAPSNSAPRPPEPGGRMPKKIPAPPAKPPAAEAPLTRARLIELLNEDLAREYQAIIAYVVYSQVLKGAAFMAIARELEAHAKQELDHALIIAKQVDYLGGTPTVTPLPVRTSKQATAMLRFDLQNENDTIRHYRERVRQCEALGEFAMAEHIREILQVEQEHQIDLATALGQDAPDVSAR
jgi:inner membrane protein